jgi:hypothetical protein
VQRTSFLPRNPAIGFSIAPKHPPTRKPWTLVKALRTFVGRGIDSQASQSQWLAEAIDAWCSANFWSLQQLATLAANHSSRGEIILLRELEDIRDQKEIYPSPRLFQALAAAHTVVHTQSHPSNPSLEDQLCFTSPITSDEVANRPSWWFALYCQEAWAREAIALPLHWDFPDNLSSLLADYLRREMVKGGRDPIGDGLPTMKAVFGPNQAELNRLNGWLLGLREMDRHELHRCIHPLLLVARNCGAQPINVRELLTILIAQTTAV